MHFQIITYALFDVISLVWVETLNGNLNAKWHLVKPWYHTTIQTWLRPSGKFLLTEQQRFLTGLPEVSGPISMYLWACTLQDLNVAYSWAFR